MDEVAGELEHERRKDASSSSLTSSERIVCGGLGGRIVIREVGTGEDQLGRLVGHREMC